MTKKDYILIALVFKDARNAAANDMARQAGDDIAMRMARCLKLANPRFDTDKFLNACGVPEADVNQ